MNGLRPHTIWYLPKYDAVLLVGSPINERGASASCFHRSLEFTFYYYFQNLELKPENCEVKAFREEGSRSKENKIVEKWRHNVQELSNMHKILQSLSSFVFKIQRFGQFMQ
ncbi:hypothetical protein AHAS_Ahas03G0181100 [Arachis hypogaea]